LVRRQKLSASTSAQEKKVLYSFMKKATAKSYEARNIL